MPLVRPLPTPAAQQHMHAKLGVRYYLLPDLYRHMKLTIFEGIVEEHNVRRKRELEVKRLLFKKKSIVEKEAPCGSMARIRTLAKVMLRKWFVMG